MNHSIPLLLPISPSLYQMLSYYIAPQTPTLIIFPSQEISSLLLSSMSMSISTGISYLDDPSLDSLLDRFLPFFSVAATLAVVLRICARRIQKLRLELNDYIILLGLVGELSRLVSFAS